MLVLFYLIIALALVGMMYALLLVMRLRKIARGGSIGGVVNVLFVFICMFAAAYAATPFFPRLSPETVMLVSALVFFFGAVFVIIVLRMITTLTQQVLQSMSKL